MQSISKGWFRLAVAVCRFHWRLCQCRDRNFSITLQGSYRQVHAAASNIAWTSLKEWMQHFWMQVKLKRLMFTVITTGLPTTCYCDYAILLWVNVVMLPICFLVNIFIDHLTVHYMKIRIHQLQWLGQNNTTVKFIEKRHRKTS